MRQRRLLFALGVFGLAALLPASAYASGSLTESLVGFEYAVGSCGTGLGSGSFAGYGVPPAIFNTTICHTSLGDTSGASAAIVGGTFTLQTATQTLAGDYVSGSVGPGVIQPLYPGSTFLCKETFPVAATLGPASSTTSAGATSITAGSAVGTLTHIGIFASGGSACQPFAAKITGVTMLAF